MNLQSFKTEIKNYVMAITEIKNLTSALGNEPVNVMVWQQSENGLCLHKNGSALISPQDFDSLAVFNATNQETTICNDGSELKPRTYMEAVSMRINALNETKSIYNFAFSRISVPELSYIEDINFHEDDKVSEQGSRHNAVFSLETDCCRSVIVMLATDADKATNKQYKVLSLNKSLGEVDESDVIDSLDTAIDEMVRFSERASDLKY